MVIRTEGGDENRREAAARCLTRQLGLWRLIGPTVGPRQLCLGRLSRPCELFDDLADNLLGIC